MNIQKITIIASLIFVSNSLYANNMLENDNSHAHHNHSDMEVSNDLDSENTIYVCPMHPEVMSESPSSCHICGMSLEKVELEEE